MERKNFKPCLIGLPLEINCLSFSLFGEQPKYLVGALKNVDLAKRLFPDYCCYFFVDASVPATYRSQLMQKDNVKVIDMEGSNIPATMWRFTAIDFPEVKLMRCCDVDSRLDEREQSIMQYWTTAETDFLVIKDHPYGHTGFPIFAGMWGMRKTAQFQMRTLILDWLKSAQVKDLIAYTADQHFLAAVIYPLSTNSISYYDDFNLNQWSACQHIPHQRKNWRFVGEVFNENEQRGYQWKTLRGYLLRKKGIHGYLASKALNLFNPEWESSN